MAKVSAWPHRNAHSMLGTVAFWSDPALDDTRFASTRAIWSNLEPFMGRYYANIQGDDVEAAGKYGPVYDRLVAIKNAHDPMNLFRLNHNVRPTV